MPILPDNSVEYTEEAEAITSENMTDGSSVTENNATYNDPFDYNGPADIGVPDPLPVVPVVPEEDDEYYYVTYYNRGDLTEYEPAYLQELAEAGCKFYAIYDDETEVEIQWTEIEDLDPLETEIDISASIAGAANQHFWDDTNGVHVAEVAKEDWQTALEAEFSDLSSSKNYYNILMNSLGLLLRRANFILTSINRASISFYDGLGNETTNIMASFGRNSAQIGRSNDKHVVIDNSGLTAYNSDGTLAPLTGTFDGANINNSSITNAKIVDGTIEGTKIASATIDNSNIKNGTITGAKIADGTIENTDIKNGTIEGTKIASATIDNSNIKNGTITGAKIASATIDNSNIKNGTITGAKIADGTIENTDIKNGTITGAKIASATIENSNIKDGTIQGSKIVGSTLTGIPYAGISDADIEVARVANAEIAKAEVNYAHITNGVIDNAKIDHADVNGLSANYATVANLNTATARIGSLEAADVTINGRIDATEADIEDLEAEDARIGNLVAQKASITDLNAATARIDDLEADHVSVEDFEAEQANIDTLQANTADIATIRANSAKVQNLTAAQLEADHATVGSLSTTYATITNLNAANGRISDLESTRVRTTDLEANYINADTIEANYTKTDLSNTDVAWIQNGTIKDGAISNAMIGSLSASKLTAGTINGNTITVTNLNADNITAGTLNGQRIGEGSLSLSKLEEDVYTESEVDSIVSNLQTQIDGAIETWTGTAVPTLNNSPASGWTTNAVKDTHVGDVYFVVNSNSQQNGYNYRFTKSGSTYSWQLIKDSDVTNALQRLSTAEGKITTFDSDISQLKTDTGTLTTKTTSLETRMSNAESDILDKVDTTTFNEVSDTVDSHSQSITQMSTTLSNKADSSTVTAVTNRVSKTEQDISGINTTIGTMQTTLASKADGSTVETMSTKLNTVSDTVDGHTQSISSITSTQTTMQGKLDKTLVETTQLWFSKANTTAPNKPTAQVTSTSTEGNAWRVVVPAYNASYPNYYYCYQWKYSDGTYGWSSVTRDIAMGESQERARTAITNAAAADTKAGNAASAAATAQSTADTANTNASAAVSTANTANTNASTALSTANTAASDASDAKTDAAAAVSTANTASSNASTALSTANTASSNASTAVSTANTAKSTADTAKATADKNVKSTTQLWYTKANETSPAKPTTKVTSTAVSGNGWRVVVPTYASDYPYYFYCYQYELADGTCTWSNVVYDRATTENQANSRSAVTGVSTLTTKTNNIQDTVDGHTQSLQSVTSTQTSIQQNAVKSTVQLWFTKANTTAPNKPTAHVTTNNSATGNAWNLAVPTYNASYPNYYYCYEYQYLDGSYGWSAVTRDIATGEMQERARTAITNAAAADTKAGNAATAAANAQADIDGLEIGGRNLLRYRIYNYADASNKIGVNSSYRGMYCAIDGGETYTISRKTIEGNRFWIEWSEQEPASGVSLHALSSDNTAMKVTVNTPSEANWLFIYLSNQGDEIHDGNIKIERGTKATDWTPAPEDVDADILTAQTSADTAQATADKNVKESVQLWFTKANGSAPNKPTSAVTSTSTSGNAWTTKVPTYSASYPHYFYCMQYKLADGTYTWSDVVYDQATTEAQSVARTTSANLSTLQQDYATFKQTTQNFESTIGTTYATKTEVSAVDDKIDNLEIGGRNLLRNTDWNSETIKNFTTKGVGNLMPGDYIGVWYKESNATLSFTDNGYLNISTTATSGRYGIAQDIYLEPGTYTLSASADDPGCVITIGTTQWPRTNALFITDKSRKSISFEVETASNYRVYIYDSNVDSVAIKNPAVNWVKLEKGNRATDWTPAPEDVDAAIDKVDSKTSVRLHLSRDNWSDAQWGAYCSIGHADNFQNLHIASGGAGSATGFDATTLNVGDLIVLEGISTGTNIPYSATAKVTSVPTSATGTIPATVISANNAKAIESRVTNAETSITQNTEQIALKANASDVYTKTQTDGLISTEVSNRNSAIEQSAAAINLSVSETYSTKEELKKSFDNRINDYFEFIYRAVSETENVSSGKATINTIYGNTVRWNQLVIGTTGFGWNSVSTASQITATDEELTFTNSASNAGIVGVASKILDFIAGHKYCLKFLAKGTGSNLSIGASFNSTTNNVNSVVSMTSLTSNYSQLSGIRVYETPGSGTARIRIASGSGFASGNSVTLKSIQLFDLTAMFGAGNEPTTVEEFEDLYPLDYYPYDPGSLLPVNFTGIETSSYNQYNPDNWRIASNTGITLNPDGSLQVAQYPYQEQYNLYKLNIPSHYSGDVYVNLDVSKISSNHENASFKLSVVYSDGTASNIKNWHLRDIDSVVHSMVTLSLSEKRVRGLRFGGWSYGGIVTISNLCIGMDDPSRNEIYEPYQTIEKSIDICSYFPTGLKKAGTAYDELTGPEAITRIGSVDLGLLTWNNHATNIFNVVVSDMATSVAYKVTSSAHTYATNNFNWASTDSYADKSISTAGNNYIYIKDTAYNDAAAFKTAMSGVILYYALATPITTPIDPPLNLTYKVDGFGTERIIVPNGNQSAPVPIDVTYGVDLYSSAGDTAATFAGLESNLAAAKAEIKVTTDGISSTVEKISSVKYLTSAYLSSGWTLANIRNYASEGSTQTFTVVSTNDVRVGDTVYIKGKDSTRVCNVYIKGTVTQVVNATQLVMTSHGYEDVLPVDTIKSTINQSSDSVKIQAKHVEIDGAAIFSNSAFKAAADAAYDAKGSASAVQTNLDNLEIGGRNLLINTNWNSETIESFVTSTYTLTQLGNAIGVWAKESQVTLGFDSSGLMTITVPNNSTRYGIYQDVYLNPGHYILSVNTGSFFKAFIQNVQWPSKNGIDANNGRNSVEFDVAESATYRVYIAYNNAAVMYGNWMKLEKSSKATDWTPAPEDVDASIPTKVSDLTNDSGFQTSSQVDTAITSKGYATTTQAQGYATTAETNAKSYADTKKAEAITASYANMGFKYKKDIVVYGDSDKYYPIYLNNNMADYSQSAPHEVVVTRGYNEQAPNEWNPSSNAHHGALNLRLRWNYGGWGGATYICQIYDFSEMYSTMLGDVLVGNKSGMNSTIYLRGGGTTGAIYHIYSEVAIDSTRYDATFPYIGTNTGDTYMTSGSYTWKVDNPLTTPNRAHILSLAAVVEEQYIYRSAASGTTSMAVNETWVTANGEAQNVWTTKRPVYDSSYPVLFVAKQRKLAFGLVTCTTPVKDDTTTIIDGGHITTGTIDTNRLNADTIKSNIVQTTELNADKITSGTISADRIKANVISAVNNGTGTINADKINAGSLTIGYSQLTNPPTIPTKVSDLTNDSGFQNSTQVNTAITSKGYQTSSQVETAITSKGYATTSQAQGYATTAEANAKNFATDAVNNLEIGGRNLLTNTQSNWKTASLTSGIYASSGNQICPTNGSQGANFKIPIEPNTPYVVQGWSELTDYPTLFVGVHQLDENLTFLNDSTWKQITGTGYSFTSLSNAAYVRVTFREQTYSAAGAGAVVSAMGNSVRIKLEKGNKTTDWTPAPEDVDANISSAEASAKGYADTKKSEAISAAATDATNKANTAKSEAISAASTDATNKANAAETNAKGYADGKASDVYEKIRSQGIQLVTNGNGFLGNNTNWSSFTFDGSKSNASPGSFTRPIGYNIPMSDEMFPIDASKEYLFEFDAISADGTGRLYSMIVMYDVDKTDIGAQHVMYYPNTLTTLAQDLNPGDTTVKLTSTANWSSTTAGTNGNHQRALVFWDYSNSFGYTYLPETYSRNYYGNLYSDDSKVNKATGVISLTSGWAGPKKLAGTPVSQGHSGNSYMYAHVNVVIPSTWTHYSYVYSGLDTYKDGIDNNGKFRQGTAFGKVGFLWNYGHSSSAPQGQIWVTNISIKEATATKSQLDSVANTANNAAPKSSAISRTQRIYWRATSNTKPSANTAWLATSGDGYGNWSLNVPQLTKGTTKYPYLFTAVQTQTVAQQAAGTACSCSAVMIDDSTTVIDGGKIITGSIDANAINASSGTFDTANIPDLNASKITSGTIDAARIAAGSIAVGKIDATSGTFSTANIPALTADHIKANVINAVNNGTGTINADKINASNLTIGYSQLTNPPTIPSKVSDLTNDSGFQTSSQVDTAITSKGYATTTQAQGYADAKDAAIAAAAKRTDVSVSVTAINYDLGTATLQATLYVDGIATTSNVTYKWLKDGSVISGQTARTLSVTAAMGLSHVYSCTVTYS